MRRGKKNTWAVLLAAGAGRRMGVPKALLAYEGGPGPGEQSFLDVLAHTFRAAGCDVLAVVGCDAERILAVHPGLDAVRNPDWLAGGQFSSAKVGLREALSRGAEAILLCPVDQPALRPATVTAVRQALGGAGVEAVVPTYEGRRGHPLGLTLETARKVLASPEEPHLEAALLRLSVSEVAVTDAGAVRDVDTPEEYQRLLGRPPSAVERAKN